MSFSFSSSSPLGVSSPPSPQTPSTGTRYSARQPASALSRSSDPLHVNVPSRNPSFPLGLRNAGYASAESLHRAYSYSRPESRATSAVSSPHLPRAPMKVERKSSVNHAAESTSPPAASAVPTRVPAVAPATPINTAPEIRNRRPNSDVKDAAAFVPDVKLVKSIPTPTAHRSPHAVSHPLGALARSTLLHTLIIRRVLLLTDGRDKIMKCIQYFLKTVLWAELLTAKGAHPRLHNAAKQTVSHFSTARKIMRLLYWLNSLDELVSLSSPGEHPGPNATRTQVVRHRLAVLNAILGIVNGWADDVVVAGKMGIIEKPLYNTATVLADRLWWVTVIIDLHENYHAGRDLGRKLASARKEAALAGGSQQKVAEIQAKASLHRVSLVKLLADFMFCSIDVFQLGDRGISDGWQAVSGLTAACLGTYKVWRKHC
ncbi:hypothetical protein HDU87_004308 [Geranomyces variabilis]|uniref:Peroxisomal biogenesis factor 11 n=1 Tax=Geranomyces variabilis TaxID=109894 RepID=A0AAD5TLB9_9FUNG|nr:hypothetical protein HDU87_004308 [Geranomyces variabilis]